MNNIGSMKCGKSIGHLSCKNTDLFLRKWRFFLPPFYHEFQKVSALCQFSNETQVIVFVESLFVLDYIGMLDFGEEVNLVHAVGFFSCIELSETHFF
jgi:hypothetical protein